MQPTIINYIEVICPHCNKAFGHYCDKDKPIAMEVVLSDNKINVYVNCKHCNAELLIEYMWLTLARTQILSANLIKAPSQVDSKEPLKKDYAKNDSVRK